jgi:formylglycine-generating enzyme required for sulfatase activity
MIENYRFWIGAAAFGLVVGCSSSSRELAEEAELASVVASSEESLVFIEGGEFRLGDIGRDSSIPFVPLLKNNKPPVLVELDGFSMQSKEVTWGEFLVYLHDVGRADGYTIENGFRNAVRLPIEANDDPESPNYKAKPARSPNYREAENYCAWLAEKTGHPFALPTEAQWEYAARNRGEAIAYATNTGELEVDQYLQHSPVDPMEPVTGNVLIHSSFAVERRPVGSYPPNPLGLHDMTGNVPEWTRDWFYPGFGHLGQVNPVAVEQDKAESPKKTVRDIAGYGDHTGGLATVYARRAVDVDSPNQGFRCVVNYPEPIN